MAVESPASRVGIDDLPDEVIVRILSHSTLRELTRVTQNVCSRWRRLSHDSALWRDKEFHIEWCNDDDATALLQQMPQLRSLKLRCVAGRPVLYALADTCSRLTTLEFHRFQPLHLDYLQKLVEKCPDIQSLAVPHRALDDEQKSQTLARLNKLQSLVLLTDHNIRMKRVHLRPLADGCRGLARLEVGYEARIYFRELEYFFNAKCESLTHLKIPWARDTEHDRWCIVPLLKICTSLIHLELFGCFDIRNDDVLEAFTDLDRLPNLRSLVINYLRERPARSLAHILESGGLSQLHILDLSHSYPEADVLEAVCRRCPQLEELRLRECVDLTDDSLRHLHLLRKLHMLALSACGRLSGQALRHVARVTTLRTLVLDKLNARRLEPELERVLDMASLEILSIQNMTHVSKFPFDKLPGRLTRLRVLDVREAILDDCGVLYRLQEQMPGLEVYTLLDIHRTISDIVYDPFYA